MPAGLVILNNTPLVALWLLGRLDLLQHLYGEVWLPLSVYEEFLAVYQAVRQTALDRAPWIKPVTLTTPQQALVYVGLDRGEAEVLALAVEQSARLVVIDERRGRRYAHRLGVPLTGTLGLLLLAKEKGLVPAVRPLIRQLQESSLFFGADLVARVLAMAGENV